MSRPGRRLTAPVSLLALGCAVLTGCAAQVRVAAPVVYVPPPAPTAVLSSGPDVVVETGFAPPALPVYEQPPCPVEGWMWTPGYWGWGAAGYYWVPGTWVAPPRIGYLWTPGYWGFAGGVYVWHAGYWGPHVGFYGGVRYGFGYTGVGYVGGRWVGGAFAYNRAVTNINVTIIRNTYIETVVHRVNVNVTRVSYNGGAGGVAATPTWQERQAAREAHLRPTVEQRRHLQQAQREPTLLARTNGGHPPVAATARAGAFHAPGVVPARAAVPTVPAAWRQPAAFHPYRRPVARRPAHPKPQHKPARRRDARDSG